MVSTRKINIKQAVLLLGFIILGLYTFLFFIVYQPLDNRYSVFGTIPIIEKEKIFEGYTLISPYNRVLTDESNFESRVYLLDLFGNPVHTWNTDHQVLYSILTNEADLVSVMELPKYSQFFPPGGNTGIIQIRDWESRVTWEYKNEAMHHDIDQLPNGNLVVTMWEKTPDEIAAQVKGGVVGTEMENSLMWSDSIVEVDRSGEIVWAWHAYEHMDPSLDVLGELMSRYAWSFINGIKYMEKNPIDGTPGYLVSMRAISRVLIVRKSDGEIIWRSPAGMLSLQHDPTLLDNGNILVFDNGLDRVPAPFSSYGSRVVEINPKTNEIVWKFEAGEGVIDRVKFFAPIVGGAQRLANGNTLITDGSRGHLFEVTREGEVVWDLVSPYTTKQTGSFPNNFLFKSRRYGKEISWPKKLNPSFNKLHLATYQLLSTIYPK